MLLILDVKVAAETSPVVTVTTFPRNYIIILYIRIITPQIMIFYMYMYKIAISSLVGITLIYQ